MVLLLSGVLIYQSYTSRDKEPFPDVKFIAAAPVSENLSAFDPNTLNHEQWQKLGFSEKQVSTILKYKDIVGGKFVSKEQLKKCYAISEEKFAILSPFILLPENTGNNPARAFKSFEKEVFR